MVNNGVVRGGTELMPAMLAPVSVSISAGEAWINGRLFSIDSDGESLLLPPADNSMRRIDRVVLRLDLLGGVDGTGEIYPDILQGTPASNPSPPPLTRNNIVWEISLMRYTRLPGGATITDIVDERTDISVCGITTGMLTLSGTDIERVINNYLMSQVGNVISFHRNDVLTATLPVPTPIITNLRTRAFSGIAVTPGANAYTRNGLTVHVNLSFSMQSISGSLVGSPTLEALPFPAARAETSPITMSSGSNNQPINFPHFIATIPNSRRIMLPSTAWSGTNWQNVFGQFSYTCQNDLG